jgi:hypothetical protein
MEDIFLFAKRQMSRPCPVLVTASIGAAVDPMRRTLEYWG